MVCLFRHAYVQVFSQLQYVVLCFVHFVVTCVVHIIGDHIADEYPIISFVTDLYVESNMSLCLPHLVKEGTLSINIVLDALAAVLVMCLLKVHLGSSVRPNIL